MNPTFNGFYQNTNAYINPSFYKFPLFLMAQFSASNVQYFLHHQLSVRTGPTAPPTRHKIYCTLFTSLQMPVYLLKKNYILCENLYIVLLINITILLLQNYKRRNPCCISIHKKKKRNVFSDIPYRSFKLQIAFKDNTITVLQDLLWYLCSCKTVDLN